MKEYEPFFEKASLDTKFEKTKTDVVNLHPNYYMGCNFLLLSNVWIDDGIC